MLNYGLGQGEVEDLHEHWCQLVSADIPSRPAALLVFILQKLLFRSCRDSDCMLLSGGRSLPGCDGLTADDRGAELFRRRDVRSHRPGKGCFVVCYAL